jgi:hypothetical protein
MSLEEFWVKYLIIYPNVGEEALCLTITFFTYFANLLFQLSLYQKQNSAISWMWT